MAAAGQGQASARRQLQHLDDVPLLQVLLPAQLDRALPPMTAEAPPSRQQSRLHPQLRMDTHPPRPTAHLVVARVQGIIDRLQLAVPDILGHAAARLSGDLPPRSAHHPLTWRENLQVLTRRNP